jgi:peptide subunit release factor 1 (eRF1)
MPKTRPAQTPLRHELDRLAAFEPTDLPVLSLYLNLAANQHGRDDYSSFVRKAFAERSKAFSMHSPARTSFDRDIERIAAYLASEVNRSANGLAIFACEGANGFFEALQLDAPFEQHWLFIGSVPHLYPLARLVDQYPRYVALVLDSHKARIYVFGLAAVERTADVTNPKTRRTALGGWSQARYQRRVDNFQLHHVKEVVETLDHIVRREQISRVVVSGDEVTVPVFREQLPPHLADMLVGPIRLDRSADAADVLQATLEALREKDAETDAERVSQLIDAWRSGGLAVAGPEAALNALQMGQVDELLIAPAPQALEPVSRLPNASPGPMLADTSAPQGPGDERRLRLADELVTRAEQTGARLRVIADASLLEPIGGAGAFLRFRI